MHGAQLLSDEHHSMANISVNNLERVNFCYLRHNGANIPQVEAMSTYNYVRYLRGQDDIPGDQVQIPSKFFIDSILQRSTQEHSCISNPLIRKQPWPDINKNKLQN